MNQSIRIAFRNIARQGKRTAFLAAAIGFGFFIVTLLGGFTGGLSDSAKTNFANAFGGHIYISGALVSQRSKEIAIMADPSALNAVLAQNKEKLAAIHRRSAASGTLVFGNKESRQKIEGVDFMAEEDFRDNLQLISGSLDRLLDPNALVLPQSTADKLGVQIGETVLFKNQTVYGQQNVNEMVLIATCASQSGFGVSSAFANLVSVNQQLGLEAGQYQTVNLWLKKPAQIDEVAAAISVGLQKIAPVYQKDGNEDPMAGMMKRMLGDGGQAVASGESWQGTRYKITTLNELMSQFTMIINTIDQIGFGIFVILMFITMVGIMNSYRMVMVERTGEIGTMRAMGVQRRGIRDIFLWEALLIAGIGALLGLVLALLTMGLASLPDFHGNDILAFFLRQGHLGFRLSIVDLIKNIGLLGLLSVAAVYLPARSASRLLPAEALRASF